MIRKLTTIVFAAALVLPAVHAAATSCHTGATPGGHAGCSVERSCENLDNGIRCTIKATGETSEAQVRECVRGCHGVDSMPEGVTVEFTDIAGGVVVTATASDSDLVTQLQAHAGGCAKAGAGCCGNHGHGHKCAGRAEGHSCCGGHGHKSAGHGEGHSCCGGHGHKCTGHGEGHSCCGGHGHGEGHTCCAGHGEGRTCCGGHGHGHGHKCAGHGEGDACCAGKDKPAESTDCPMAGKTGA